MFWTHGGCYTYGSGSDVSGVNLVETGQVIVVIVNYRLGVFGFLGAD